MTPTLRRIASAVLMLVLVAGQALVCAPVSSAAERMPCAPDMGAQHDCCPPADRINCCSAPDSEAPAVPGQPPTSAPRPDSGSTLSPLGDAPVSATLACPRLVELARTAPPHGYRTTDLSTLHAVFLL